MRKKSRVKRRSVKARKNRKPVVRTRLAKKKTSIRKPKVSRAVIRSKVVAPQIKLISLPGSKAKLYVNLRDRRGIRLLKQRGSTQPKITRMWKHAVNTFQPDIVVDVGVNYGEIIFSTEYPSSAKIIGIEANPQLRPYVTKSLQTHPNQTQMEIVYALASDREGSEKTFYVDKYWSGTSSTVPIRNRRFVVPRKVNTVTVDSLLSNSMLLGTSLVFKIDVEGYEAFVIKGMNKLLTECARFIGLIEFNNQFLKKAGTNADAFLTELQQHAQVFLHTSSGLIYIKELSLAKIKRLYRQNYIHTDLLLLSKNESATLLGLRVIEK